MDVIHGPRRASAGTYDVWRAVLRESRPRFEFTDPPFRHSLPMTLAFAATASRPTAVLTGPLHLTSDRAAYGARQRVADSYDMVRVGLRRRPLTATAVVAWSGDLPRHLQQVLFDTADAGIPVGDPFAGVSKELGTCRGHQRNTVTLTTHKARGHGPVSLSGFCRTDRDRPDHGFRQR